MLIIAKRFIKVLVCGSLQDSEDFYIVTVDIVVELILCLLFMVLNISIDRLF